VILIENKFNFSSNDTSDFLGRLNEGWRNVNFYIKYLQT